jgi:hypothetical protein
MNADPQIRSTSPVTTIAFRIMGVLAILCGLLFLFLYLVNMNARKHGGHDLSGAIYFAIYWIPVGIGMLFLRRVFAVLITLPSVAMGLWLILGSIFHVSFPWLLINILYGCVFLIPGYLTIKAWNKLK